MAEQSNRVSYIRKPFAVHSPYCIGLVAVGLGLFGTVVAFGVKTQGQVPLSIAAVGFCSILMTAAGMWYGVLSFMEKEKNYILAKIGVTASGILLILWLVFILIGLRG